VDLPTYTSIWRIEKRLYKLYDFRLPMPLPIGQITVFAAIAVPYVVLLTILGVPFSHTLVWLYVLPPGAATWLVTRPVLEGKRLPELIKSQLRYLAEPRVWCRMAPLGESDVILVTGRVWRMSESGRAKAARRASAGRARASQARAGRSRSDQARSARAADRARPVSPPVSRAPARPVARGHAGVFDRPAVVQAGQAGAGFGYTGLLAPPVRQPTAASVSGQANRPRPAGRDVPPQPARPVRSPTAPPTRPAAASPPPKPPAPQPTSTPAAQPPGQAQRPARPSPPVVKVVNAAPAAEAPPALETALAGPGARRSEGRVGRVTVVPGGHRPGKPDQLQRDRVRARLPIDGSRRVVVLGCTVGAGQTAVTLVAGEVLASLRSDLVAVLDLNPGAASLARQAQRRPALGQAASLGSSRLAVLTPYGEPDPDGPAHADADLDPADAVAAFEQATATHQIVLADPSTAAVTRLLTIADQLVLVAPASAAAARAIAMTFEWLEAHAQADLAADAIMVMNGVSRRSMPQVEQAERLCIGRCRAIVRLPWDDQLKTQTIKRTSATQSRSQAGQQWTGLLSPPTVSACTALAGVLAAALAGPQAAADHGLVPR
jgi:MinD-like ATPase involved in chromosome partitioning or flagellar assembly